MSSEYRKIPLIYPYLSALATVPLGVFHRITEIIAEVGGTSGDHPVQLPCQEGLPAAGVHPQCKEVLPHVQVALMF